MDTRRQKLVIKLERIKYIREKREEFKQKKRSQFIYGHWKVYLQIMLYCHNARNRLIEYKVIWRMKEYERKCFSFIFERFRSHLELKNKTDPLRIKQNLPYCAHTL